MQRQTLVHVAVEFLIVSSLAVYLSKRLKSQDVVIHELKHTIEDQSKKIEKLSSALNNLYAIVDEIQIESYPRNVPQPIRRRTRQAPPQHQYESQEYYSQSQQAQQQAHQQAPMSSVPQNISTSIQRHPQQSHQQAHHQAQNQEEMMMR